MKQFFHIFLTLLFLINNSTFSMIRVDSQKLVNLVTHKDDALIQYLDFIGGNLQEKIGLLPYIKSQKTGTFLEIGAGGDSIALLLSQIPNDCNVTVIASDIDNNIVQVIPNRHPRIKKYLDGTLNIKLYLRQLNATALTEICDNSLSGINASAVVHEIISYAGVIGINKFLKEAFRALKDAGVLVYRDPEGVSLHKKMISMQINSKNMKLFVNIFLPKFLDQKFTKHVQKLNLYKLDSVRINLFFKTDSDIRILTLKEFLLTPTRLIDFEKPFILFVPQGLGKEIERHYLTFLHQCNPLVFVKPVFNNLKNKFEIQYYTEEVQTKFLDFYNSHDINAKKELTAESIGKIQQFIEEHLAYLEKGMQLNFQNTGIKNSFVEFLKTNTITVAFVEEIDSCSLVLDYKIFGLLYEDIKTLFFQNVKACMVNALAEEAAKYLKREGEESYFYSSPDEFIAYVGAMTLTNLAEGAKILAPINAPANQFIARSGYQDLLRQSCLVKDCDGKVFLTKEGKRIIHFAKMPIERACKVYREIIEQDPKEYSELTNFVERRVEPLIFS